jgi:hypothetical protein
MKKRCLGTRHNYGGRGISVCDRWAGPDGYLNFVSDMGRRPTPRHSIDRIDVNGNYEPSNCRWATPDVQANNKRTSRYVTAFGETLTVAQWSRRHGVPISAILHRLRAGRMAMEDAVSKPPRRP